jgi:biopolymer transport protein ExbD
MERSAPEIVRGDPDFSYSEPFGLMAHLQRPSIKLDFVPVLDLLMIALLFGLLFTRFVMVPGIRVDLPDSEMQMQPSKLPVAVLTIGNNGMLFFDGSRYEIDTIEEGFRRMLGEVSERETVLLVKTQGSMNLELFLRLCRMAQIAGFAQVQIAGEHLPEVNSLVPSGGEALGDFDSGFLSVM